MPYDVTSWFQEKLEDIASEPVRKFTIGTSDYSDRVTRWPRIKRTVNDLRCLKVSVPLDNTDGHFNGFYSNVYTIPNTATLQMGFENESNSGTELLSNEGFEDWTDGDPDDWNDYVGDSAQETTEKHGGSSSCKFTVTGGETEGYIGQIAAVTVGVWYRFSVWVKNGDGTSLEVWIDKGTAIDKTTGITSTSWQQIIMDFQATAAAVSIKIFVVGDGKYGYFDDTSLKERYELIRLYTGFLKNVSYKKEICETEFVDNLYDFEKRKVGDSDAPASFSAQIPSDIAWTLCTCYGGKSNLTSTNNPDIDYASFQAWAAVMSAESLACAAQYDGVKVIEGLANLAQVTDSCIWVEGDGKINFLKYEEASSLDITFMNSHYQNLEIDVESQRLVNKAYVPFNYAVDSEYFQHTAFAVDTTSINSYDIHEEIYKDETIWHTTSVDALVHGQRKVTLFSDPPRRFGVNLDLYAMRQKLGETVRLVDSFYGITSSDGWRLVETELNMDNGQLKLELDEAAVLTAFYLDVDYLDSAALLL